MGTPFNIKGVNPGTGKVVEFVIVATSAQAAKAKAEEAGLQWVVATPASEESKPDKSEPT